jgi:hypothetical protein
MPRTRIALRIRIVSAANPRRAAGFSGLAADERILFDATGDFAGSPTDKPHRRADRNQNFKLSNQDNVDSDE